MKRRNAHVRTASEAEAAGRKAWSQSTQNGEHLHAAHPSEVHALGRQVLRQGLKAITHHPSIIEEELHTLGAFQKAPPMPQPNLLQSMIPVVGPAWEFAADVQRKRYGHAVLDAAVGALDLPVAKAAVRGGKLVLANKAFYRPGTLADEAFDWDKKVRPWMVENGHLQADQQGHHWGIRQNGPGKNIPKWIKNQTWNIKAMDPVTHGRVHHRVGDLPRFGHVERYVHGTPDWWKAAHASAAGHGAMAGAHSERHK
jgi:hypothetical protein